MSTTATQTSRRQTQPAATASGLGSSNAAAVRILAGRLHQAGHLVEAGRIYDQLIAMDDQDAAVLHARGVLFHQQGDHTSASRMIERAASIEPDSAVFLRDLGEVYRALSRFEDAIVALRRALELEVSDTDALCNLGHAYLGQGKPRPAEVCYRRAAKLLPDDAEVFVWLGCALRQQNKTASARAALTRATALDPENGEARFLLAVLSGDTPPSAPADYIRQLFDGYAATFDTSLTEDLAYHVPQQMREQLDVLRPGAADLDILDLGCGTGMAGLALANCAATMVGVDLSPAMLDRAAARGVYNQLVVGDLLTEMASRPQAADLLVAADVVIYVGELDAFFARAAEALKPGGLLLISTEAGDQDDSYCLKPSARYAHGTAYVRNLADTHGFVIRSERDIAVRTEGDRPVAGQLWAFERR